MKINKLLFAFLLVTHIAVAQETFHTNGVKDVKDIYYAFINANISVDPQTHFEKATLLIKNGIVEKVGNSVTLPKNTVVYDLKGKFIYPGLIDIYTSYGMPEPKKRNNEWNPQMETNTRGAYNWNQAIRPETDASKIFSADSKSAEELRKLGFSAVVSFQKDGIARGSSVLVSLADGKDNEVMIKDQISANYSFDKGSSTQDYPSSLMGAIALLRQTYLDAQWYKENSNKTEFNISLNEWNQQQRLPQVFEAKDKLSVLRADALGDEFKVQYIIKGGGDEYQRMADIKSTNASLIIPVDFPVASDVEDPFDAMHVWLEDLKHWELAPYNPAYLEKNKIQFALTTADLKDKNDFWKNLGKAVKSGLSPKGALKALTTSPAAMLNIADKVGSLKAGMLANFIITSDTLFSKKNIIHENWIQGKRYVINNYDVVDITGNYKINFLSRSYTLKISGEPSKPEATLFKDTVKIKSDITISGNQVALNFDFKDEPKGTIRLTGIIDNTGTITMSGKGRGTDGAWFDWNAVYESAAEKDKSSAHGAKDEQDSLKTAPGKIFYPCMAYGWQELPKATTTFIKNATVWTNEKEGVLIANVLLQDGKIKAVGKDIQAPAGATVIDGTGKHLTSGIIDEHSHIAISNGVNEGTQSVTAEVRIGDVINSDDINIYRQLSGGVTASQLLHGSANCIGGQSALIKLRWGQSPSKMKIEGADGFIKFALGENVKQSNWGDKNVIRFPQTRMGVEQVYYDAFTRAKEYNSRMKKYATLSASEKAKSISPRRDLELEALVEILDKKRFITCHSYVQSEINMLMHVGDSMGFRVNTFTHILEGYKVADKMKAHGAGGSTFSDWWAYKFEVNDAIPYNAAILNKMGVVTAINSDDAEMGRRLNQEAAKTIKYGNVSEEDAWKMVTLNPAKLLHLDNRMGSIKAGKDADVVLWSDHPLSIYAKVEQTFVDGICYYDAKRDEQLRVEIEKERARIIQKMIIAKKGGEPVEKPKEKKLEMYDCMGIKID